MAGDYMHGFQVSAQAGAPPAVAKPPAPADKTDDGFSFGDLLDIINPLQHLPIISTIYRHLTGDTIKPMEQIAGDTLFGGLTGLVSSVADYAFEKITGKDLGDTVYAFVTGEDDRPASIAAADTSRIATHAPTPLMGTRIAQAAAPETATSLMASIERKGVSSDIALRALSAYQSSLLLPKLADAAVP
jgi:hypothetical protein